MKFYVTLIFCITILCSKIVNAQIEEVIVEEYYIAGPQDTITTDGGKLEEGTVTYRIYVDLLDSSRLVSVFGDTLHTLVISSSEPFYNNEDRDVIFGYKNNKSSNYDENTVALDSWITLGYATTDFFGIPKNSDPDGSIDEIAQNEDGMLQNEDPRAGIPLTVADGLIIPDSIYDSDKYNESIGIEDSTIFSAASNQKKIRLNAEEFVLRKNSGTIGVTDENIVLIAQLTTKGELTFELNLEIDVPDAITAKDFKRIKYVALSKNLDDNTRYSKWLRYPFPEGCTNPYFAQYEPTAITDDGSCKDSIILGCMDEAACNFNPNANWPVEELCCYGPGELCDNRDISVVCPDFIRYSDDLKVSLYPNPVTDKLNVEISSGIQIQQISYSIINTFGMISNKGKLQNGNLFVNNYTINVSNLEKGIYLMRFDNPENGKSIAKIFIK